MKVCTVREMQALDRGAVESFAIPEQILMESAGHAVYTIIQRELGVAELRFAVLCGGGNNGGDGLVVARKLNSTGAAVRALVLSDPDGYGEASRLQYDMLTAAGVEITVRPSSEELRRTLDWCHAAVDGLFGTGLTREVEGRYRDAIEALNGAGVPVVSIDIPSGVDGDTGRVWGVAVDADITVTFGLPKRGNLLYPGAALCGQLVLSHISFPPQHWRDADVAVELSVPPPLPPRPEQGHKGTFGDAIFVAGAASYYGAPTFAALSMMKAGGGYARLAAPRTVVPTIAANAPEIVFAPQQETAEGSLALSAEHAVLELAAATDFAVVGPGISLEPEAQELARRLVSGLDVPVLVDGDGLTAVAEDLDRVRQRSAPTVLTPHPGEMARLTGTGVAEVVADPIPLLQRTARDLGAIVVLKGAHTLVGMPDGRVLINLSGNSGMGSAGSGDVLTGAVAAMHGLGLELHDAVPAGVFVHGLAGDVAAAELGEDGITAADIMEGLSDAVRIYREEYDELMEDFYGALEVI